MLVHETEPPPAVFPLSTATLEGYSDEMLPTLEGLRARTLGAWATDEFTDLTAAELEELGIETGYTSPGTIQELVGGFPSEAELAQAYEDGEVKALLARWCGADVQLERLYRTKKAARTEVQRRLIEVVERERACAAEDLVKRMDEVSGFKDWALLHRLWTEFSK